MSSLTGADKLILEKILGMGSGCVLDFSDARFGQFFSSYNVDIHDSQYQTYGPSKAKKMRAFWEKEPDELVERVLSALLDVCEVPYDSAGHERDSVLLKKGRQIVARLSGVSPDANSVTDRENSYKDFEVSNIQNLPVAPAVADIILDRLEEAQKCLSVGAYLSVIFQCGSVLEAILLGVAKKEPERFNKSASSPKRDGKPKAFREWSLSEFINVASDIGLLQQDVKTFSHGLREFRNYIHPEQQMSSGFKPDKHTAELCFNALRVALADVSGER